MRTALAIILGTLAALFIWGLVRVRRSAALLEERLRSIDEDRLQPLAEEAIRLVEQHLGEKLAFGSWQMAATLIDRVVHRSSGVQRKLMREEMYWYFVLPLGAFLGELLRREARGAWRRDEAGEWAVDLHVDGEATITTYPFRKVQKHHQLGSPGDLLAYVGMACEGAAALRAAAADSRHGEG